MRICKYCKKPISDNDVWNPDEEGNGYHHACLSEMEFRSRDKQIYDKGRADALDKIRAEIERQEKWLMKAGCNSYNVNIAFDAIKSVLTESEVNE